MGFLSRLFGNESHAAFEDRVWRTTALKLEDLTRHVEADARDGKVACLVVYHFPDTGELLRARFDRGGLSFEEFEHATAQGLATPGPSTVALMRSGAIPGDLQKGQGGRAHRTGEVPCHVHLAEHFPVPAPDERVLGLRAILPSGSRFFCYVGLDEPWISKFLGSTVTLMERLGAGEDEPVEHPTVASALRRAQKRLAQGQGAIAGSARSCAEWMRANVRD